MNHSKIRTQMQALPFRIKSFMAPALLLLCSIVASHSCTFLFLLSIPFSHIIFLNATFFYLWPIMSPLQGLYELRSYILYHNAAPLGLWECGYATFIMGFRPMIWYAALFKHRASPYALIYRPFSHRASPYAMICRPFRPLKMQLTFLFYSNIRSSRQKRDLGCQSNNSFLHSTFLLLSCPFPATIMPPLQGLYNLQLLYCYHNIAPTGLNAATQNSSFRIQAAKGVSRFGWLGHQPIEPWRGSRLSGFDHSSFRIHNSSFLCLPVLPSFGISDFRTFGLPDFRTSSFRIHKSSFIIST